MDIHKNARSCAASRALLVRLSLIPLLIPIIGLWLLRDSRTRMAAAFLLTWATYSLGLALFQAR